MNIGQAVEAQVRIAATAEALFPYFTVPEQVVKWMGVSAELDARPGGAYRVKVNEPFIVIS